MTYIYDKGFQNFNIIGQHDQKIKNIIIDQLGKNDLFINTTWIELDDRLTVLLKKNPKKVLCYSGPDWENTSCIDIRRQAHQEIQKYNPIHIGNYYGKDYFSFWLDFVYDNISKYERFNPYDIKQPMKHFMCLNRKPHEHRIKLVNAIKHLQTFGYISLGGDNPLVLDADIINNKGDNAVAGDVGISNDITSLGHEKNWNSHFLNVVSETTIHTNVFLSEKIFKPIIGRRPFIVLGDYNIYDVLKSWGIDTFDDLFGTGYELLWYEQRIDWIRTVLEDLVKEKNLDKLLISLKPRLENNYRQLMQQALNNKEKIRNI